MSTDTNGSATDASNGSSSNKHSQNNDWGLARRRIDNQPPSEVSIKRKPKKNSTSYELGIAVADTYNTLLHPGIHNVCSHSAHAVLGSCPHVNCDPVAGVSNLRSELD